MTDVFFEDNPFVGINRIRFIGYNLSPGFILWAPLCLYFGRKVKQKIEKADNNLYFLRYLLQMYIVFLFNVLNVSIPIVERCTLSCLFLYTGILYICINKSGRKKTSQRLK